MRGMNTSKNLLSSNLNSDILFGGWWASEHLRDCAGLREVEFRNRVHEQ